MIVEFFKRGRGKSSGPIDYFLGKNRDREYAKLLSGDLEEVAELIDSSPYVKKYTAGCLSFFEDDLSDAKKKNIMAAFEKTLFPGLKPDQYRVVWIEHQDKENTETGDKRLELNFLIPNVEISTGKRLQPFFAKADLNRVDDFKTIVNHKYQLFDPDDPINRRSIKIAKDLPQDKKDFISAMNTEVALAITDGLVSDRESLKEWMTRIGLEITRITKNQISVKNPNNPKGKPIPLKGEFYEQNFRHSEQSEDLKRAASEEYRREAESRYANSIERYGKLCESKSRYHLERFGTRDRTDSEKLTRQLTGQENAHTSEYKYNGGELEQGYQSPAGELKGANKEHECGLADIERIEPSNSRASEAEKSPFFIEYSPSFDSTYFAYIEYMSRLRQQKQIQRHHSDGEQSRVSEIRRGESEYSEVWGREGLALVRSNRPNSEALQGQLSSSTGNQLNESRSTIIADYRTASTAAQRATETVRASLTAYSGTEQNNRRIREIQQRTGDALQSSDRARQRVGQHHQATTESDFISRFIAKLGEQLKTAITEPFRAVSDWLEHRGFSKDDNRAHLAADGGGRDQKPIESPDRAIDRKTEFSRAISTEFRGINPANIFSALDKLDQRRELQRAQEQAKKNDRGYDSPSPF
ncbi:relaxase/mobilization nuclease domain-containing protein [Acinetobacter pittii]|uniref:relaxase/mobilization nuclease domain-containing protein n=3 Tax=Acinetobacter pittii TaxID=48296 RepID=UPI0020439DDC|nr:relaxase/mobilization nuclease domain-containing protein [Acinetobacter pittii]MCM5531245.1 relaxase/mobilization nuclease domain-containing protein [Acinetobacter pittii]